MTAASPSRNVPTKPSSTAGTVVGKTEFRILDGLSRDATRWLEARGLCPETASRMGVTTALAHGRAEWAAFPTIVRGHVKGWQFRRIGDGEPRFMTSGGAAKHVWNFDVLLDETLADQPLIITEGRCDALAAIQSGFPRTISVPGGGVEFETRDTAYKFVAEIEPLLHGARQIIVATDDDGPGLQLMDDLAKRFGRGRCKYIERPAGAKDLNALLLGYGERAVVEAIGASKWLHVPGVYLPCELPPRPRTRQHVSGMPGLDEHYRVRRQDWCVVTGYPGCGKSTWLNDLAFRMAENHGWRTCFASFEQPPQTQQMWALRRLRLGKEPRDMTAPEIGEADEWINEYFRFVVPDEDEPSSMSWLFDMFGTAIVRHGVDMCVLDPWNELEHDVSYQKSMTQYVGDAIRDMKRFAKKWNVHFIVAAHPAKPLTKGGEAPEEPRLHHISDSAHWWNKADVGVVLHTASREDGHKYTQCRVAKSKYHDEIGKPGVVAMNLNVRTGRYHEVVV